MPLTDECQAVKIYLLPQRPQFMPPPMGNMPPPPGMIFPPGMPPSNLPSDEIWVENTTPEGKVLKTHLGFAFFFSLK